jgi:hypothetical protein
MRRKTMRRKQKMNVEHLSGHSLAKADSTPNTCLAIAWRRLIERRMKRKANDFFSVYFLTIINTLKGAKP